MKTRLLILPAVLALAACHPARPITPHQERCEAAAFAALGLNRRGHVTDFAQTVAFEAQRRTGDPKRWVRCAIDKDGAVASLFVDGREVPLA